MSHTPDPSPGASQGQGPSDGPQRLAALRSGRVRIGALATILVAIGFIVWAAVGSGGGGGGGGSSTTATSTVKEAGPFVVSLRGLQTTAGLLGQPVFWVGPRSQVGYEVTQTRDARMYIRYIPAGAQAGVSGTYLTVGTYPMKNALAVTGKIAQNNVKLDVGGGAAAFAPTGDSSRAYIAFPGADFQIEVFDPAPGAAVRLVEQGLVHPVPRGASQVGIKAMTPAGLKGLAAQLGQPVYWVGADPGKTYEVTQTNAGSIYVRYLPGGVKIQDPRTFLTVGTYPMNDAIAATRARAGQPGYTLINLPKGGVAAVGETSSGTNAFVAYPNSGYQAEVFDPKPGNARKLALSRLLDVSR